MLKKSISPFLLAVLFSISANTCYADKGQLEIISKPGNAKIYINGKRKGSTPEEVGRAFVIKLSEGDYMIEAVSTEPFELYVKKEVFVADDTLQPITLELKKGPSANFRKDLKRKHPNPIEPEMVSIKGGYFQMGCVSGSKDCESDVKSVHTVTVGSFLMSKYEVTFNEWDACVAAGGCSHYPTDNKSSRGQRAVSKVSWDDTQQYIKWLNQETGKQYRLPTEAEWEYAARAGTKTKYSWGNSTNSAGNYAWYIKNTFNKGNGYAHRVGAKKPNPWGLYDMHGNVWEWTQDWYDVEGSGFYKALPRSSQPRVARGGSWEYIVEGLLSAIRRSGAPGNRYTYIGFRLMRKPNNIE